MASSNNDEIISKASPHTIKKFELIEAYVQAWAHKLLEYGVRTGKCNGIVFIDCMSNSGIYTDNDGNLVEGTPVRVAKVISAIMRESNYQNQQAFLYFNDLNEDKIAELRKHLPDETRNFHYETSVRDGNELLKQIGKNLSSRLKLNYLLVYDPYTASIDWEAIAPFLNNWGEVILNHMVSDSIRAVPQAKKSSVKAKYENTYLSPFDRLLEFEGDRQAYANRIETIINELRVNRKYNYYIASYPFFNTRNALVYDLIHCTSSEAGFKLYKSTAWKTFGDRSSIKNRHGNEGQLVLDFTGQGIVTSEIDENCYNLNDIVFYLQQLFTGKQDVPLDNLWSVLDKHPVFPSDGYKSQIKSMLKKDYGAKISKSTITFSDRR